MWGWDMKESWLLALDVQNSFNSLSRHAIWRLFEKHYLRVDCPLQGLDGMYNACEILWSYVQTYYGVVGKLRYYRDGNTFLTDSKVGVHQGDPLGSVLLTLAIHDKLIDLVGAHNVHIFEYADNLTLFGEVKSVTDAANQLSEGFMEDGLALNGAE